MRMTRVSMLPARPFPRSRPWLPAATLLRWVEPEPSSPESTDAAADIEPSKALWKVEPGEEGFAYKTAPTAHHHPLTGFSVSEKLSFLHVHLPHVFSKGDFAVLYLRHSIAWKMSRGCDTDVRFGSKADVRAATSHVRFTPESGHVR
jgi:hypothetical protein